MTRGHQLLADDRDRAEALLARAEAAAEVGAPSALAFARYSRAGMPAGPEPDLVIELYGEAIELARANGAQFVEGIASVGSVRLRTDTGRARQAFAGFGSLLGMWRRSGYWPRLWTTLRNLAVALADPGPEQVPIGVLGPCPSGQAGVVAGDDLTTRRGLALPAAAIEERFARGSGPGGQHKNVTSSAVELIADLSSLRGPGADLVRATHGATLRARAEESRSQWRNRTIARARLADAIDEAAFVPAARRPTRPSRGARQRRLDAKHRASQVKRSRSWRPGAE